VERGARNAARARLSPPLTKREAEVLEWVRYGKSNAEIAAILSIELPTVKKHLQNIYIKLGVHNRTAAANFAVQPPGSSPWRFRTAILPSSLPFPYRKPEALRAFHSSDAV
jgi:DNA-binding CsgD family transcriptional regulator